MGLQRSFGVHVARTKMRVTYSSPAVRQRKVGFVFRQREGCLLFSTVSRLSMETAQSCAQWVHFTLPMLNTLRTKINVFYLKIQSVPRSKHTPSQLYKPVS
jgi:hypothetical protein